MIEGIVGIVLTFALVAIVDQLTRSRSVAWTPRNPADVDALAGRIAADRSDSLLRLRAEWLADDRPAFETVDAFERDVERVLRGDIVRGAGKPWGVPRSEHPVTSAFVDGVLVDNGRAIRDVLTRMAILNQAPPAIIGKCPHRSWTDTRCDVCGTTVPFRWPSIMSPPVSMGHRS